ncbi:hypothetical protein FACS1894132_08780 [Clostridia bacterium]|nr:hypothetical protein FACS1894132_08780 [Clostridia bacterium]
MQKAMRIYVVFQYILVLLPPLFAFLANTYNISQIFLKSFLYLFFILAGSGLVFSIVLIATAKKIPLTFVKAVKYKLFLIPYFILNLFSSFLFISSTRGFGMMAMPLVIVYVFFVMWATSAPLFHHIKILHKNGIIKGVTKTRYSFMLIIFFFDMIVALSLRFTKKYNTFLKNYQTSLQSLED